MKRQSIFRALTAAISITISIMLSNCEPIDPIPPTVTTGSFSNVLPTQVTVSGSVSDPSFKNNKQKEKSGSVSEFGFVYATVQNPTLETATIARTGTTVTGSPFDFQQTLTGLTANATYYVRAYAKNSGGVAYGNTLEAKTGNFTAAALSGVTMSNIATTTARATFTLNQLGNSPVTDFGVCYSSSNSNPTTSDTKTPVSGAPAAGSFGLDLSGLNANTTYTIRAYAVNAAGTAYGTAVTFLTASPPPVYTVAAHTSATANTSGHITTINHTALNNNPNAIVIVTANWQGGTVYNPNPVGLWYSSGKWTIFNQNFKVFPAGVKYNLLITNPTDRAFKHVATGSNTNGHITTLDHPLLNNNPNAKLLVTQRWNGTYNDSPVGVWYNGGRWRIFNQNAAINIKAGCEFNVVIDDRIFITEAKSGKISGHTFLIEPSVTGASTAVFVSQYWTSVYNNQEVGVWLPSGSWSIYNQNTSVPMPVGAKFFILTQ